MPTTRGKPYQSKLIVHEDYIRELRQRRVSYREIARLLASEKGCPVYYKTIINFIRVRSRPLPVNAWKVAQFRPSGLSPVERLKQKPLPAAEKPKFDFDPEQPLTLTLKGSSL